MLEYFYYFLFLLILFSPTFIANAVPVVIKNIPFVRDFKKPINEKLFWKNKTYRWFISGVFFAVLISILFFFWLKYIWNFEFINKYYEIINSLNIAIIAWLLQWFWALFWDIFESFIKRRIGKKPGEAWPFWDGIDYIIWAIIFFAIIFVPTIVWIVFLILFSPLISLIANIIAYLLWWKNVWY